MQNNILLKISLISVSVVSFCCFFGPYNYAIKNDMGLIYYYFFIIVFLVPLIFCSEQNRALLKKKYRFTLNCRGEKIIAFLSALSILASVIFFLECLSIFSIDSILAGDDLRVQFSLLRSGISKLAEIISCCGPACFLITCAFRKTIAPNTYYLSLIALFGMGMTGLLLGARWKLFVCLLLFIFTILLRKKEQSRKVISVKKLIASLSVILLLVLVLFAFMYLFSTRGVLPADEQYHFYLGDMSLKYGAQTIYNMTDGVIQPLYRAFDYIGQAPYVFSVLFADYMPDQAYFGSFVLRPIGEIASIIGLPFLTSSDIVADTFTGMYSGSAYGFIIDFGIYGAPVAAFISGCVFAAVERRRCHSGFSTIVFPLLMTMAAIMPIYYLFQAGYIDFIFCWALFSYLVLLLFGGIEKKEMDI